MPRIVYHWTHDHLNVAQRGQVPASLSPLERLALFGHLACKQCRTFYTQARQKLDRGMHSAGSASEDHKSSRTSTQGMHASVIHGNVLNRAHCANAPITTEHCIHSSAARDVYTQPDRTFPSRERSNLRATAKPFIPPAQPSYVHERRHVEPWPAATLPSSSIPRDAYIYFPDPLSPSNSYPPPADPPSEYRLHTGMDTAPGDAIDACWPDPQGRRCTLSCNGNDVQSNQEPFLTQGQH